MFTINMEKARIIWREKIADARKAAFEKNDIAIRDAQLDNDSVKLAAAIERRRAGGGGAGEGDEADGRARGGCRPAEFTDE